MNVKLFHPLETKQENFLKKGTGLKNAKLQGAQLLLPGHGKNGPTIEIHQYESIESQENTSPNKRGFGYIAFKVESVEKVLDTMLKNRGQKLREIVKRNIEGAGEITLVYARDPEGNIIALQNWK